MRRAVVLPRGAPVSLGWILAPSGSYSYHLRLRIRRS